MNKIKTLALFLLVTIMSQAKGVQWNTPYVGYSNNQSITFDKVTFSSTKTTVLATISSAPGKDMNMSSEAFLSSDGKRYAIRKATEIGLDKTYSMPDSGKLHFEMTFEPLPADSKLIHFCETDRDEGWKLCNIRRNKDELQSVLPDEWKDVSYSNEANLPLSRLSDDSTFVYVNILNYVPEAGRRLHVSFIPIDDDKSNMTKSFDINNDGTAVARLHPCFPTAVQMSIGSGEPSYILIQPGCDLHVLADMGESNNALAAKAFRGALATVNYELNVKRGIDIVKYYNSDLYFESQLSEEKDYASEIFKKHAELAASIRNSGLSGATEQWLELYNDIRCSVHINSFEKYATIKLKDALASSGSTIAKNKTVMRKISTTDLIADPRMMTEALSASPYKTMLPYYMVHCNTTCKDADGNVNQYNVDVCMLDNAISSYIWGDVYGAENAASKIQDKEMRDFYYVAIKRWNQKVKRMNQTPHVHFRWSKNMYEGNDVQDLKQKILSEFKGKEFVMVVYSSNQAQCKKILNSIDSSLSKSGKDDIVFVKYDLNPYISADQWYENACKTSGEHYRITPPLYSKIFPDWKESSAKCLFEFYSAEGEIVLRTTDEKEVMKRISKR